MSVPIMSQPAMLQRRLIGVLGGMGPLATVDFMQKVIQATAAKRDQDHVPMIVYCVPQIPDRVGAVLAGTDEPFVALSQGIRVLENSGVELIVIPCNTAHAWFDRLAASTIVPMLHIADAVQQCADAKPSHVASETIALMATTGTLHAGFFQHILATPQRRIIVPTPKIQAQIGRAIQAVKTGDLTGARDFAEHAAQALLATGADRLLLACTELPLAFKGSTLRARCLDATVCLAEATVAFSLAISPKSDVTQTLLTQHGCVT